jgi:hypothetical protein
LDLDLASDSAASALDSAGSALADSVDSAALTPSAVLATRLTSAPAHTLVGQGAGSAPETPWPAALLLAEAGQE